MSRENEPTGKIDLPIHNLAQLDSSLIAALPTLWIDRDDVPANDHEETPINFCACPSLKSLINSESFNSSCEGQLSQKKDNSHIESKEFLHKVQQMCIENSTFTDLRYSFAYKGKVPPKSRVILPEKSCLDTLDDPVEAREPEVRIEKNSSNTGILNHDSVVVPRLPDSHAFPKAEAREDLNKKSTRNCRVTSAVFFSKASSLLFGFSGLVENNILIAEDQHMYCSDLIRLMQATRDIYDECVIDGDVQEYPRLSREGSMLVYRMFGPPQDSAPLDSQDFPLEEQAASHLLSVFDRFRSVSEKEITSKTVLYIIQLLRGAILTTLWRLIPLSSRNSDADKGRNFFSAVTSRNVVDYTLSLFRCSVDGFRQHLMKYASDEEVFDTSAKLSYHHEFQLDIENEFLAIIFCQDLIQMIMTNLHNISRKSFGIIHAKEPFPKKVSSDDLSYVKPEYFLATWLTGDDAPDLMQTFFQILAFPAMAAMNGTDFHLHELPRKVIDMLFDLLEMQLSMEKYRYKIASHHLPTSIVAFLDLLVGNFPSLQTFAALYSDPFDAYSILPNVKPDGRLEKRQRISFHTHIHLYGRLNGKYVSVLPILLLRVLVTIISHTALVRADVQDNLLEEAAQRLVFTSIASHLSLEMDVDNTRFLVSNAKMKRGHSASQSMCQMLAELLHCTLAQGFPLAVFLIGKFMECIVETYLPGNWWDPNHGITSLPGGFSKKHRDAITTISIQCLDGIFSHTAKCTRLLEYRGILSISQKHLNFLGNKLVISRENALFRIRFCILRFSLHELLIRAKGSTASLKEVVHDHISGLYTSPDSWKAKMTNILFAQESLVDGVALLNYILCLGELLLKEIYLSGLKMNGLNKGSIRESLPQDIICFLLMEILETGPTENSPKLDVFFSPEELIMLHSMEKRIEVLHQEPLHMSLQLWSKFYQSQHCEHTGTCAFARKAIESWPFCLHYQRNIFRTLLVLFSDESCSPAIKKIILALFSNLSEATDPLMTLSGLTMKNSTLCLPQIAWKLAKATLANDKNAENRQEALKTIQSTYFKLFDSGKLMRDNENSNASVVLKALTEDYILLLFNTVKQDASPSMRTLSSSLIIEVLEKLDTIVMLLQGSSKEKFLVLLGVAIDESTNTMLRLRLTEKIISCFDWIDTEKTREKDNFAKLFMNYWLHDLSTRDAESVNKESNTARSLVLRSFGIVDILYLTITFSADPFIFPEDRSFEILYAHSRPADLYAQIPLYAFLRYAGLGSFEPQEMKNELGVFKSLLKGLLLFLANNPVDCGDGEDNSVITTPDISQIIQEIRTALCQLFPENDRATNDGSATCSVSLVIYCLAALVPSFLVDVALYELFEKVISIYFDELTKPRNHSNLFSKNTSSTFINLLNCLRVGARYLHVEHFTVHMSKSDTKAALTRNQGITVCDHVLLFVNLVYAIRKSLVDCVNRYSSEHANLVLKASISILNEALALASPLCPLLYDNAKFPSVLHLRDAKRGFLRTTYILFNFSFVKLWTARSEHQMGLDFPLRHLAIVTEFSLTFPFESIAAQEALDIETGETPNMLLRADQTCTTSQTGIIPALYNVFAVIYDIILEAEAYSAQNVLCAAFECLCRIVAQNPGRFFQRSEKLLGRAMRSEVFSSIGTLKTCTEGCRRCEFLSARLSENTNSVLVQGLVLRCLAKTLCTEESVVDQQSKADSLAQRVGSESPIHARQKHHDRAGVVAMWVVHGFLPDIIHLSLFAPSQHSREICLEIISKLLHQSVISPEPYFVTLISAYTSTMATKEWHSWTESQTLAKVKRGAQLEEQFVQFPDFIAARAHEIMTKMYLHTITETLNRGIDPFLTENMLAVNPLGSIFSHFKRFKAFRKAFLTGIFAEIGNAKRYSVLRDTFDGDATGCWREMCHWLSIQHQGHILEGGPYSPLYARFCFFIAYCLYAVLTKDESESKADTEKAHVISLCDSYLGVSDFFEMENKLNLHDTTSSKSKNRRKKMYAESLLTETILDFVCVSVVCILKISLSFNHREAPFQKASMGNLLKIIKIEMNPLTCENLFEKLLQRLILLTDEYQRALLKQDEQANVAQLFQELGAALIDVYNDTDPKLSKVETSAEKKRVKARKSRTVAYADSGSSESEYSSCS